MSRVDEMHEFVNLAVPLRAQGCKYLNGQIIDSDGAVYNTSGLHFCMLILWGDEQ